MNLLTLLLNLYPREWRARYEDEFVALIEQSRLLPLDALDIAIGALDAHRRPQLPVTQVQGERRYGVNRTSFIKWSGIAGMAGSVLALAGLLTMFGVSDDDWPYLYDGWDIAARASFVAGVVLIILFAAGLLVSHGRRLGAIGQVGMLVAFAGLLSMAFGISVALAEAIRGREIDGWWYFFTAGLFGTLAGSAIFGGAGLTRRVLPSIAAGTTTLGAFITLVILLLMSIGMGANVSSESTIAALLQVAMVASFVCFKAGLLMLGYSLWTGRATGISRVDASIAG